MGETVCIKRVAIIVIATIIVISVILLVKQSVILSFY